MLGGSSDQYEADEEVKEIANSVKDQVEKKLGKTFETFDAVLYKTQVVAGKNYKIKVHVGEQKFIHIKVHIPLPGKNAPNQLLECKEGKTFFDRIR